MTDKPKSPTKLKPKHEMFVKFYLGEAKLNASKAAKLAGYKTRANTAGHQLLTNPDINARISQHIQTAIAAEREPLKRRVLEELQKEAFARTGPSKLKALDLLCKYLGFLVERHEVTGANGGPLEIKWPEQ
jgi:phage terminase small subunit